MIQKALCNEFYKRGMDLHAVTVVTQVEVDAKDPAFENPSKPIGSFLDEATAKERMQKGQTFVEDAGRGWRQVVPSPKPMRIVEVEAVQKLVDNDFIVVAVGGGGIPVVKRPSGFIRGIEAVIDKDFASGLLANLVDADLLLISTAVEKVAINFNKPDQQWLVEMTVAEAEKYIQEGHFAPGSMLPKVQAIIKFLKEGGKKALVTDPPNIQRALRGETGTWIVPG
jgi:carbamate kinase